MSKESDVRANQGEAADLLDRLFVAALSDNDHKKLMAAVVADKEVMQRYIEIVSLREGLPYLLAQPEPRNRTDVTESAVSLKAIDPSLRNSQIAELADRTRSSDPSVALGRWRRFLAIAVCVAFVMGTLTTSFFSPTLDRSAQDDPQRVQSVSSSRLLPFTPDHRLGRITGLSPEASAEGMLTSMQVGQELRRGEVVQLSKGFVRVRLELGQEIIVEGPAEFSLVGKQTVFVRVGRVSAISDGKKLVLQSPLVTADFKNADVAFVAEEEASTSIFANDGIVTLYSTAQEEMAREELQILDPQSGVIARATGNSHLALVPASRPANLIAGWNDVEARLSNYQQSVLSDRPLAYWPLGRVLRNHRVLDLSQNGFDGLAIGNWPTEFSEAPNGELGTYFNGECYIEPDRKPPINPKKGFTVEAWAKVAGPAAYQSLFTSRWVFESNTPKQQCFGFTLYAGDDDCWQFWTGNGRYGEPWNQLKSTTLVDRDQWTHVVATFVPTGNQSEGAVEGNVFIYVNGQQIAAGKQEMSLTDFEWPARIGAAEFVPMYLTSWLFKGYMRHVAVYNYPLEVPRIEAHRRIGQLLEDSRFSLHKSFQLASNRVQMEI